MNGYQYIYKPNHPFCNSDGYVAEHRLIYENKIKRYLEKNEVIHHKNHDRLDNDINNLMLISPGQHTTLHLKGKKWNGNRKLQSVKIKEVRKNKFWSTKQKV